MTALSEALAVQSRIIAERRAEQIRQLRMDEAECVQCGIGPDAGVDLRMHGFAAMFSPEMICGECFGAADGADFSALPLVWAAITGAHE